MHFLTSVVLLCLLASSCFQPFSVSIASASFEKSLNASTCYKALESNLADIGADGLMKGFDLRGTDEVIGIVDTGLDPLIPCFAGKEKVIDWIDLTEEGKASILGELKAIDGVISRGGISLRVEGLKSLSQTYVVGVLPKVLSSQFASHPDIYFVAYDPLKEGVYEAVAVDANMDLILTDETILHPYTASKSAVKIQIGDHQYVSVVLTSIGRDGKDIRFGFDLTGHGTGMASILSGYAGVAPDARLIAVKAIPSTGTFDWQVLVSGIKSCLNRGASVVLLGSVPHDHIPESLWLDVERLAQSKNAHIVMPAGDKGPGVGTLTASSAWPGLIISSGYYPSGTLKALFPSKSLGDTFYLQSSCGPDLKGNRGIGIVAPVIAPVYRAGYEGLQQFGLMEGTSVSAAYAAGAVCLLREGSKRLGDSPLEAASSALVQGANPLDGILPVEQGYGKINLVNAWSLLSKGREDPRLKLVHKWNGNVTDGDLWVKGNNLGALPLWVDNFATAFRRIELKSTADWLKNQGNYVDIMPVAQRSVVTYGCEKLDPGFYGVEIIADDSNTPYVDAKMAVSIAIPNEFAPEGSVSFASPLYRGSVVCRQFVNVPDSAQGLTLSMQTLGSSANFTLYNPDGLLVEKGLIEDEKECVVGLPKEGLWQICFFTDPLDEHEEKTFILTEAKLKGVCVSDLGVLDGCQGFAIKSDEMMPIGLRFISSKDETELRHRMSVIIPPGESMFLPLVTVSQGVESLWLRFGTGNGHTLKAYLYYLDETSGKWIEIDSASSGDTHIGQIQLDSPPRGRYMACIEGGPEGDACYAEIDYMVLESLPKSDSVPMVKRTNLLKSGLTHIEIETRRDQESPQTVIIRKERGEILGVIERASLSKAQTYLVQLTGTGELKTIKAFAKEELFPVDLCVVLGGRAYQLYNGKVTAPLQYGEYGTYQVFGSGDTIRFKTMPE